MKRSLVTVCVFALLSGLSGCSGNAEDLYKKQIDLMNNLADAIEKKDEAGAQSIVKELNEVESKLKDTKVTADEKKRIEDKYKDELGKAVMKLLGAMMKDPEFSKKINYDSKK